MKEIKLAIIKYFLFAIKKPPRIYFSTLYQIGVSEIDNADIFSKVF